MSWAFPSGSRCRYSALHPSWQNPTILGFSTGRLLQIDIALFINGDLMSHQDFCHPSVSIQRRWCTLIDIGYAYARGKPIYALEVVEDLAVMSLIKEVIPRDRLVEIAKGG